MRSVVGEMRARLRTRAASDLVCRQTSERAYSRGEEFGNTRRPGGSGVERDRFHLYMFQFSFRYGDEIYLPYSAGILWAYASIFPEIAQNFENKGFVFVREQPDAIVARLDKPSVAAFSTYVWNWEMSVAVARELKRRYPKCLTVFGGPQVPDADDRLGDFFVQHPYIDIAVHGEGEITFAELLKQYASSRDYLSVAGLSYRGVTTPPRQRTRDLDAFPSPYLTGVFESLFELPFRYQTVWETNRGCPYGCTFCDWGSLTAQKLSKFVEERLYREIDYFGSKKISHVYMADANFGILPRDVEIASYFATTKARTGGFPSKLRVNYAKSNPERVHSIAKILNAEQLDKGITLSVQSMNEDTLRIIKRKNLHYDTLSSFIKQYQREGINTYTEVIVGLPGETYQTFKDGIETLLEASAHDSLWIYRCTMLPNAPMNDAPYRAEHQIRTVRTPIFLNHTEPGSDPIQEYEDTVVETATLSREEYERCLLLAWAVQTFHALGLTQVIAIYARIYQKLPITDFYEALLAFGNQHRSTVIGGELDRARQKIVDVFDHGESWDDVVPEFSNLTWAMEEASYLRISSQLARFYRELELFLDYLEHTGALCIDAELQSDLRRYQEYIIVRPDGDGETSLTLNHSLYSFHHGVLTGESSPLRRGRFRLEIVGPRRFAGDAGRFATEIVFWGRRGGKTIYQKIIEEPLDPKPFPQATATMRSE
jgi:radical SAM superfamily enzyme YgiQ (UPF0313 family)